MSTNTDLFVCSKLVIIYLLLLVHHNTEIFVNATTSEATNCMESYRRNISAFSVCQHRPCLIFKEVVSYVSVESKTFSRYPFPCQDSLTIYRKTLRGPYFPFIQNIPALNDAYCIFAGDECSFDDQIKFLSEARRMEQGHQFIVSGLMFIMSYRINNDSIPSTPFTHGPILIVGPIESPYLTFLNALEAVSGPFETTTWVFILIILLIYVLARIGISMTFTTPFRWIPFWWNVWGEYEAAEEQQNINAQNNQSNQEMDGDDFNNLPEPEDLANLREQEFQNKKLLVFYNKYWTISAKVFFFLTVLFYELALFNHVFEILARPPRSNIQDLPKQEMERFVLVRNSGYEGYFRLAADSRNEYLNADDIDIPWQRVDTVADAYKSMMENRKFSVCFERSLIIQMKTNYACDKLTFFETDAKRTYNGGWFYSRDVPENTRLEIDKSLTELVEEGRAQEILHEEDDANYRNCGRRETRISFILLFLPLVPLSLFIIIGIFFRLMYCHILRAWRRRLWTD